MKLQLKNEILAAFCETRYEQHKTNVIKHIMLKKYKRK